MAIVGQDVEKRIVQLGVGGERGEASLGNAVEDGEIRGRVLAGGRLSVYSQVY